VVPEGIGRWYEAFERRGPSLRVWLGATRDGAQVAYRNGAILSGFAQAAAGEPGLLLRELDALVEIRDRYDSDHYRKPSGAAIAGALQACEVHLHRALELCGFLREMRFVLIDSIYWRRRTGSFVTQIRVASGESMPFLVDRFESQEPFTVGALYLLRSGEGSEIHLSPFWIYRICQQNSCQDAHIFFLSRRTGKGPFESVAFDTDHMFIDAELPEEYPDLGRPAEAIELSPEIIRVWDRPRMEQITPSRDRIDLPALYQWTEESLIKAMRVQQVDREQPEEQDDLKEDGEDPKLVI
jgi:hypothetical protein